MSIENVFHCSLFFFFISHSKRFSKDQEFFTTKNKQKKKKKTMILDEKKKKKKKKWVKSREQRRSNVSLFAFYSYDVCWTNHLLKFADVSFVNCFVLAL